jgi:hypothetical protein
MYGYTYIYEDSVMKLTKYFVKGWRRKEGRLRDYNGGMNLLKVH